MSQKKKWADLGIITKNEVKDKDGNVLKDKEGKPLTRLGFQLDKRVTILVDGEPVDVSRFGILKTPMEEVEQLYKSGAIGDDKIEERRETAKNSNSWLRYKVQLPPPKSTT